MRLRLDVEVDLDAPHSGSLNIRDPNSDTAEAESRWQALQPSLVEADIDEGAEEHVSGDAAGGVEDRDFHGLDGWTDSVGKRKTALLASKVALRNVGVNRSGSDREKTQVNLRFLLFCWSWIVGDSRLRITPLPSGMLDALRFA